MLTLASIIQKEAGNVMEMPLISAVFHNRLKRGIALQADPTVIYGIKDFDGNLTRKHLETPTPYNTYRKRGLPPGPIASPGAFALHAAATPAKTKDLYFVARGDGTHEFNATLKEHNRAVRRYQLKR
ncbi:MAG: endolytic transglycosylase MltG [Phycisphaerae bacterium]|nr:endolytic transglycosylase MltG [Gammaproteobacteria bacterium]NIR51986.1 endolytic transglycosylase MltG [candidate division KSB1 bacterium]NIV02245.1 endolytic transglycosylase MltG [Phycisphaerae bacterium]NIU28063.1 endolytic transglycosylase MltG [candidate division KSB1 bacterium]NIV69027.1 endolytic transglycosylase MltG [Phycisphaerae bacterium]